MTCGRIDYKAVHCSECGAVPGQQCTDSDGNQQMEHAERMHLAYAIEFPQANFNRAEAEKYRLKYPEVTAHEIICAPSRAQVLWWGKWGVKLRYDREAYEREHGHPDDSIKELPPTQTPDDPDFVGQKVSEILDQLPGQAKVRRKRKPSQ